MRNLQRWDLEEVQLGIRNRWRKVLTASRDTVLADKEKAPMQGSAYNAYEMLGIGNDPVLTYDKLPEYLAGMYRV